MMNTASTIIKTEYSISDVKYFVFFIFGLSKSRLFLQLIARQNSTQLKKSPYVKLTRALTVFFRADSFTELILFIKKTGTICKKN